MTTKESELLEILLEKYTHAIPSLDDAQVHALRQRLTAMRDLCAARSVGAGVSHSAQVNPCGEVIPDYDKAFERLKAFVEEGLDWDGSGGQPASVDTAVAVMGFLSRVQSKGVSRPSLTLSNSGAVNVIWKRGVDYITVGFQGCTRFVAMVSKGGKINLTLESPISEVPEQLKCHLFENYAAFNVANSEDRKNELD